MTEQNVMPEPVPVRVPPPTALSKQRSGIDADAFVQREVVAYLTRVKAGLERSRRQD